MGLTRVEQIEALSALVQEDYDAYGHLVEEAREVSREQKIDLLHKGLVLAGRRRRLSETNESALLACADLVNAITRSEVAPSKLEVVND